jgi:hypothetical protein
LHSLGVLQFDDVSRHYLPRNHVAKDSNGVPMRFRYIVNR